MNTKRSEAYFPRKVFGVEFKREITPLGVITLATLIVGGLFAWWDFTSLAQENAEDLKSHIQRDGHDGIIEFSHNLDKRLVGIETAIEDQRRVDEEIKRRLDRIIDLQMQQQNSPRLPYRQNSAP